MLVILAIIAGVTWWLWPRGGDTQDAASGGATIAVDPVMEAPRHTADRSVAFDPQPAAEPEQPSSRSGSLAADEAETGVPPVQPPSPPTPSGGVVIASDSSGTSEASLPDSPSGASTEQDQGGRAAGVFEQASTLIRAGEVVEARRLLSGTLRSQELAESEAEELRAALASLSAGMVFGPEMTPGDPFARLYTIRPGDALSKIASREGVKTNWRFVQRINGISNPSKIRSGQRIKLIQGPFHAEVDKSSHRMDIWLGEGDEAVFVRSFPVGLGEFSSTPHGAFRVRRGGKMVNPSWTNPRTGERFAADDPLNPFGEFWIGLNGIDPHNLQERGFGIHGTIEPDSIGEDRSMGCIRLADGDVDLIYEMLTEGNSVVEVRETP